MTNQPGQQYQTSPTEQADRPNIVLIMADQWRGDCLSGADHPVVRTPFLDRLARRGARFDRAYSACPTCIPARASLFTGQRPATHGRVGYHDHVPWTFPVTLAGELTRHGYQTEAVGKMHFFPERARMGFEHIVLHSPLGIVRSARQRGLDPDLVDDYLPWLRDQLGRSATFTDHGLDSNSYIARPWDKPEHVHPTNFIATQAADFLRRRDPTKPFFLFASFNAPHPPYDPPSWAFEQYRDQPMPPRLSGTGAMSSPRTPNHTIPPRMLTPSTRPRWTALAPATTARSPTSTSRLMSFWNGSTNTDSPTTRTCVSSPTMARCSATTTSSARDTPTKAPPESRSSSPDPQAAASSPDRRSQTFSSSSVTSCQPCFIAPVCPRPRQSKAPASSGSRAESSHHGGNTSTGSTLCSASVSNGSPTDTSNMFGTAAAATKNSSTSPTILTSSTTVPPTTLQNMPLPPGRSCSPGNSTAVKKDTSRTNTSSPGDHRNRSSHTLRRQTLRRSAPPSSSTRSLPVWAVPLLVAPRSPKLSFHGDVVAAFDVGEPVLEVIGQVDSEAGPVG